MTVKKPITEEYVVIDLPNNDIEYCSTKEEAIKIAEDMIYIYRKDSMSDGWPNDLDIRIYQVISQSKQIDILKREDMDADTLAYYPSQFDYQCDYKMTDIDDRRK